MSTFAELITAQKNESELWLELVTRSRIRVHGADNPDRLRGTYRHMLAYRLGSGPPEFSGRLSLAASCARIGRIRREPPALYPNEVESAKDSC